MWWWLCPLTEVVEAVEALLMMILRLMEAVEAVEALLMLILGPMDPGWSVLVPMRQAKLNFLEGTMLVLEVVLRTA